ncbi:hypothetical protein Hanom_Chr13g01235971 [Helianthus anomalus]
MRDFGFLSYNVRSYLSCKVPVDAGKCSQISGTLHRPLECKQQEVVPPHDLLKSCKTVVRFSPTTHINKSKSVCKRS